MSVTITLPRFWFLVKSCGCIDGSMISVRSNGSICCATAEDAWKQFTPTKRARDREARLGWECRGATDEEAENLVALFTTACTHEGAVA